MKIALVNPSYARSNRYLPLGLAYLASALLTDKHNVTVFDGNAMGLSIANEELAKQVVKTKPDVVGVSICTNYALDAYNLIGIIKQRSKAEIWVGGPHPSAVPLEPLRFGADHVIVGEGEVAVRKLANGETDKQVVEESLVSDLNKLTPPATELFRQEWYPWQGQHGHPFGQVVSSRGCSFGCKYCSKSVYGRKFRQASPEYVFNEVVSRIKTHQVESIGFADDVFTTDRNWVYRMCELMKLLQYKNIGNRTIPKNYRNPTWTCITRLDLVDYDLLKTMKGSGCTLIDYGVESGSQKILDAMNKNLTVEQMEKGVEATRKAGINYYLNIIFGHPLETPETVRETRNLWKRLVQAPETYCGFLIPYPDTPLYREYEDDLNIREWWLKHRGFPYHDKPYFPLSRETVKAINRFKLEMEIHKKNYKRKPRVLVRRILGKISKIFFQKILYT